MNGSEKQRIRIAILDLYEGEANEGMRCIREIIHQWTELNHLTVTCKEFDVRLKNQVPDTSFDIYISSGGPGSPLASEGSEWEKHYFNWLQSIEAWNNDDAHTKKKSIYFICHSFQLACRHYALAEVNKRRSTAFGIFPVHLLEEGKSDPVFEGLPDPLFAVDSRDYQVVKPDHKKLQALGATILAIEKDRPHVPLERAVMAIRYNEYMIGTQFHPEADATGMTKYFMREDKKKTVIESHGEKKWLEMIEHLDDPDKIFLTNSLVLPNFLNNAIGWLQEVEV
jgi:GMP synthase - Glutamine amidotransferase domain